MRKKIVAGNWKMNNDLEAGKKLAQEVLDKATGKRGSSNRFRYAIHSPNHPSRINSWQKRYRSSSSEL